MTDCPDCAALRREMELWERSHTREHEQHGDFHDREHAATQKAIDKAESTLGMRLEGMNAIREQLREQADTFLTTAVFNVQHDALIARIDRLVDRIDKNERWQSGIEGRTIGIAAAIGLAVTLFSVAIHFLP